MLFLYIVIDLTIEEAMKYMIRWQRASQDPRMNQKTQKLEAKEELISNAERTKPI